MKLTRRNLGKLVGGWTTVVTGAHLRLNVDWAKVMNDFLPEAKRKLNVAYIPVT